MPSSALAIGFLSSPGGRADADRLAGAGMPAADVTQGMEVLR